MARNNHQESETARAGVREATDRAEDVMQTGIQAAQRVAEEFGRVLGVGGQNENLTRQASQNFDAITETGSVLIRGFQDVSREWLELTQERLTGEGFGRPLRAGRLRLGRPASQFFACDGGVTTVCPMTVASAIL